ncbi:NAD(P)/FAD-dependent oxidoreductase [Asanoa hainanensis]|uniref:NAD(P)/FAD-dependent oxidoreductase n=1 Tax=Asanoa hainanensis TaxID=560556 RepID=UPI000B786568|nr:NAD(P)/FAD-dependent oxidoreductase [Asanoa hainanensis]
MPASADVVIVGGGLAGLAAARRLDRAGLDWVLVEGADRLGGRVATDDVDGYRLDRGFQVLNTAYPRLSALVDLAALDLCPFTPGVLVRRGPELVRLAASLRPGVLGASLGAASRLGSRLDLVRFAALVARYASLPPARLLDAPETTAEAALRQAGLSHAFIEELARPFLSGVFADRSLETSSHVLAMIVRSFARGRIAVPATGMAALPAGVAAPLPAERLHVGAPVGAVAPGTVSLVDGPVVRGRAVLVAAATTLLPGVPLPRMHALTTYYHSSADAPLGEPTLLLDGDRREIVANTVVVSAAAPGYAPPGRSLIATSVVGPAAPPEPVVRAELARLYGVAVDDWDHLRTASIPAALPAAPPPQGRLRAPVALGDGLFVAGDHRDSPSIQGALASGWRAAGAVIATLR